MTKPLRLARHRCPYHRRSAGGAVALRGIIVQFGRPRDAQMTRPIARDPIYRRRRFDAEIIELCVRWYITYRLSYRDLVAMMAERGIAVSRTTIHRWVIRYVPEFEKRWKEAVDRTIENHNPPLLVALDRRDDLVKLQQEFR